MAVGYRNFFTILLILSLHFHAPESVQGLRILQLNDSPGIDSQIRISLGRRSLLLQPDADSSANVAKVEASTEKSTEVHDANRWTNIDIDWKSFTHKLLTRQMGSQPPDCDGKCGLCRPCEAVEVPISKRAVQNVQQESTFDSQQPSTAEPDDTNYMPESWRCSCGDEYYDP